jgi:hypothetical protein
MEIGPLLLEQRRVGDEFRVAEKAIQDVQRLLVGSEIDPAARARMEVAVASRIAELMRLGQRLLELDASVTAASLGERIETRERCR